MSATNSCCDPCSYTPPVQIPGIGGLDGAPGAGGTAGLNAFSTTSTGFPIPGSPGGSATIPVNSSAMFAVGQIIFVSDGSNKATFLITAKPAGGVTLTGTWLAYVGDSAGGTNIITGALAVPGSSIQTILPSISDYHGSGSQALTNAAAQLLSSTITLTTAGSYLLISQARLDLVAATFAATHEVTLTLQRTNNTPGAVPNATVGVQTGVVTTITATLFDGPIPPVVYTAGAGDIIQVFGLVAVAPGAGALNAVSCSILAIKLF